MTLSQAILLSAACLIAALFSLFIVLIRRRNLQYWLTSWLRQSARRRLIPARQGGPIHLLLCIADHFEPAWGNASDALADARVETWCHNYPRLFDSFRDSDGHPPRHTFFYPIDQYQPRHVDALAGLCRQGFGEVEIHLHHDHDTPDNLERTLQHFTHLFAARHRLLGRHPDGRIAYGFVHGNWALDNSRPDGRWCGVRNELDILRRTGCYADFTFPSAPDPTQPRKINSIYYAVGKPNQCKSHDRGRDVGAAPPPRDSLMLIQGPLSLHWPRGRWTPRIENACLQRSQPPTMQRLDQWLRAGIQVPTRPDWYFVKLHTHGATEANQHILLGEEMAAFHRDLHRRARDDARFRFHYVSAREMYNLARAAEAGWSGPIKDARSFEITSPPVNNIENPLVSSEYSE